MNILCCNPPGGAFFHITRSWGRAIVAAGHKFKKWNGKPKSWSEFSPDLYLGCSGHRQNILQNLRGRCKVGIHVNPYGPDKLQPVHGVNVNESADAIKWTISQKPDFVFGYGLQSQENYWSSYKKKHNIPWFGVPTAADLVHYYPDPDSNMRCDVGFVGGRWGYKRHSLDPYLVPLFKKFNYKCYGWGGWDKLCKWSVLPDGSDIDRKLFSSARVCPCISEPHTRAYSIDWPERIFKVSACGGLAISDPIKNFDSYLPRDLFPMASNPKEFVSLCKYYVSNNVERDELASRQRDYIIGNHSYYHRVAVMLRAAGFCDEAEKMVKLAV